MFQEVLDNELVRYDEKLEHELAEMLRERQVRVSTAESMTGGLLSHRLMIQPGSSDYFAGGVVCYDNLTKINTCGVSAKTLRNFGLVSKEVCRKWVVESRNDQAVLMSSGHHFR